MTELVTNKTFMEFVMGILGAYGLPAIMVCIVIFFILFITYQVLKKRGFINGDQNKLISELKDKLSAQDTHHQVILEVLDKIIQKQQSSLTPEQSQIICNLIVECIISRLLAVVMECYNPYVAHPINVLDYIQSEMESVIRMTEREIEVLPNIKDLMIPLDDKLLISKECPNSIVDIIMIEKNERECARKCKSIISTHIKNKWLC